MPKATTTKAPETFAEVENRLLKARRRTRTYDMPVEDPADALEQVEAAAGVLRRARATDDADAEQTAQQELAAARERLGACYVPIVMQSISAKAFTTLVREHPSTTPGEEWDPETFQPALIAACSRDHHLTAEQWAEKFEDEQWPLGERNAIFAAALEVNLGSTNERYQQVMRASQALLPG